MITFVDDERHYVKSTIQQTRIEIIKSIEQSVSSWNELVHF